VRSLKTEVEKGSACTVIVRGLIGPKAQANAGLKWRRSICFCGLRRKGRKGIRLTFLNRDEQNNSNRMHKLVHTLLLLCLVATLAHADSTVYQNVSGTVNSTDTSAAFSFQHNQSASPSYQSLSVFTTSGDQSLDVMLSSNNSGYTQKLNCVPNSFNYAGVCQYSFSPCVAAPSGQYSVNISYPVNASGTYAYNFLDSLLNFSLSWTVSTIAHLKSCCGYQGGSWVYINPYLNYTLTTVTLTLTSGSLTHSSCNSTGLKSLDAGLYVLPTEECSHSNDLATLLLAKSSSELFKENATTTTIQRTSTSTTAYWVYVLPARCSAGEYSLNVKYQTPSPSSHPSPASGSHLIPFSFWHHATQALEAALRNHSSALKWRKFFQRSDEVDQRLAMLPEAMVQRSIHNYFQLFYYLKAEELRAKTPVLQAEEAALRDHNRGTGVASDEAQEYALGGAFTYCAGDCRTSLPHTKLGDACTLLGFDVPWSVLRLTKRCYQDPMPYAEFREWWAIHSKASTSRWPF